jgi:DNA segregation ATPase FtsK/SpoIIIE, S-DNA-T family
VAGVVGRPADAPKIIGPAVRSGGDRPLTSSMIVDALANLGIDKLTRALTDDGDRALDWKTPVQQVGRLGWEVEIDLPGGVTAGQVIALRDRLAGNLRYRLDCVWPEPAPHEHPSRLVLYVAKKPMAGGAPPAWPLAVKGGHNVFKPLPIGVDQRGRPVSTPLILQAGVLGAKPRMGKTAALRLLATGAVLDPRVELHVYACKGGGDFNPLRRVAHAFSSSADMGVLAPLLVADLRAARLDLIRRADLMAGLGSDVCPDQQITDELANLPGLHPVVWIIDECQYPFGDPVYGEEIEATVDQLVRVGPAYGVIVLFATQRPDKASLPTSIEANLGLRWCFRVKTPAASNMVLGQGMHGQGYRATDFTDTDKGICWFIGVDEPAIMRWSYLDIPATEAVVGRAYEARRRLGRLTGQAAGVELAPPEDDRSPLDDIADVWGPNEERVTTRDLVGRLADSWPDRYGEWTTEILTKTVGRFGLRNHSYRGARVLRRAEFHEAYVRHIGADQEASDA